MAAFPGNYATPGAIFPGMMLPGQVITGSSEPTGMQRFLGPEALVYVTYIDVTANHTLVATPGQAYMPAPPPGTGQPPVPADGLWTPA